MSRLAAVILAAGAGTRMGTPKADVVLAGRSLLAAAVDHARAAACEPILIVAGAHPLTPMPGTQEVRNEDWRTGPFSSLRTGLERLRSAAVIPSGVLVLTLDRPRLLPATLAALGAAHREHPDALVEPACGGRRGHPPLLPWRLAVAALDAPESTTLRDLLRAARATGDAAALRVDVPDGAVHENVDTPADLV